MQDGPRAVLFDFDGVLVHSLDYHLRAWVKAVHECYGQSLDESWTSKLSGLSTQAIGAILAAHYGPLVSAAMLCDAKRRYLVADGHGLKLVNGVKEAFAELTSIGTPFGIASNAPRPYIEAILRANQLAVKVVLGSEDTARPKPSPEAYLVCAQRLGVSLSDHRLTLVFEDSVHGLQAGVAAGMRVIGVTTEQSATTLLQAGAIATCRDLADALSHNWFREWPVL